MGPRKRNPKHPEAQSEFHGGRRIVYGSIWLSIGRHQTFGAGKAVVRVGRISTGRVLTTRFTKRGNKIRIIGAAEWRRFRRLYHETTKFSPLEN